MPPRAVADLLATRLGQVPGVQQVDVAGPGFLNVTLDAASAGELARTIVDAGTAYGRGASEAGRVVNPSTSRPTPPVRCTSDTPDGPRSVTPWSASCAPRARTSPRSTTSTTPGPGGTARRFGAGEPARRGGAGGRLLGEYVDALAAAVREAHPDILEQPTDEALRLAWDVAYPIQLAAIKGTLDHFHVVFDVWFSERALHDSGAVEQAVERLREQGHVFDREGAIWLRTTDFGDDKDRVLIRANDVPTYFAADAAYYLSKKDRGFDEKIYLLGADHHGYINRLKAIAACAGDDPEHNIEVKIGQLVNIAGERMGKRLGNALYMDDLIAWIGSDAVRYSLARYPADSPLSLDGEEMRRQTNDNPVFYVQYAHARTAGVARLAAEGQGAPRGRLRPGTAHRRDRSRAARRPRGPPRVVAQAAHLLEPHRVARYLEDLAARYHKWYDTCRVRPLADEEVTDLHRTRLWLNDATRQVLANGLDLLGVSAPERM